MTAAIRSVGYTVGLGLQVGSAESGVDSSSVLVSGLAPG